MSPASEGTRLGWRKLRRFTRIRVNEAALWILGIWWLWGIVANYRAEPMADQEFSPAIQESKLQAWDRVHRMNHVLAYRPAWEQWLFGYEDPAVLGRKTYASLQKLSEQNQLDERGQTAMDILAIEWQIEDNRQAEETTTNTANSQQEQPMTMQAWRDWETWMADEHALWWESDYLLKAAHQHAIHDLDDEFDAEQKKNHIIFRHTYLASAASYLIFLAGVAMVPRGLRRLRQCLREQRASKVVRYSGRISLSLIGVLLLATDQVNNLWLTLVTEWGQSWQWAWWREIGIDSLWRLLPALLILGILYRKPTWVARAFELLRRPQWSMILALYALLLIVDFGIFSIMQHNGDIDPTEHVDAMESGWMGLVYGIISACIIAPVAEEFIFRGLLFRGMLHKYGFVIAAMASSLVFAVSHFYDVYGTISVGLFGLAAAALYLSTRSLTNAIILHAIYNLTITVPSWILFHSPI